MPNPSAAFRPYKCRDGWIFLACEKEQHWQTLAKFVGRPEFSHPHTWGAISTTPADGRLSQILELIFASDTVEVWLKRLQNNGVPCNVTQLPVSGSD